MSEEKWEDEEFPLPHSTIPLCLSNPTLGAAANGVFLDVMEAQADENHRAEVEGRPARIAKRDARYPNYSNEGSNSDYADVTFGTHYDDGEAVVAPQGGNVTPAFGKMLKARAALIEGSSGSVPPGNLSPRQAPQVTPKARQERAQASSRPPVAPRNTVEAPQGEK